MQVHDCYITAMSARWLAVSRQGRWTWLPLSRQRPPDRITHPCQRLLGADWSSDNANVRDCVPASDTIHSGWGVFKGKVQTSGSVQMRVTVIACFVDQSDSLREPIAALTWGMADRNSYLTLACVVATLIIGTPPVTPYDMSKQRTGTISSHCFGGYVCVEWGGSRWYFGLTSTCTTYSCYNNSRLTEPHVPSTTFPSYIDIPM